MSAEQDNVRPAADGPDAVGTDEARASDAPPRELGMRVGASRTPLGLVLGGAAVVLALMVGLLAFISIERSEAAMARLLAEKGSSLIMAFESILRSGMRSETGVRLQVLLEEMAASPDIIFVAVTMPDGTIVAHSKRFRLGEILQLEGQELDEKRMRDLDPGSAAQWGIMKMEGQRVFVVYRYFTPGLKDIPKGFPMPIIFLGLDVSPFEITRSQNRDYVAMLAAATLLAGLLCLLALYYAQRARESRRRQYKAIVVAMSHHKRSHQPGGHAPGRGPDVLLLTFLVRELHVKRLGEVLSEKMRGTGL